MSSWEEVRRLAADLQRVQLGEAAKKLSDRNVVEVVSKLTELGLVQLVYTIDGKEYVTRQHLVTQIKNECLGNNGRVSLVDLSQTLNIDYQQIEAKVQEIVKNDPSFSLSVGQLISRSYLDFICQEVNQRLQEEGHLTISEVTKSFDLPSELVAREIREGLGTTVQGIADQDDQGLIYTEEFVQRQKSTIRGAMSGMTKVMPISKILGELEIQPSLFFRLLDELIEEGNVKGSLTGGRRVDGAVFVPLIFTELLRSYTKRFFLENGYIEFGSLKKLGVTDFVHYTKDVIPKEDAKTLIVLGNCVLGKHTWDQIVGQVDEAVKERGWADVGNFLPQDCNTYEDCDMASTKLAQSHKEWTVVGERYLYQPSLIAKCERIFDPLVAAKAEAESGNVAKLMKAQQTASQKSVEEPETRGGKKKGGKRGGKKEAKAAAAPEPSDTSHLFEFMGEEELGESMGKEPSLEDCPQEILAEIAEKIRTPLNIKYKEKLESIFLTSQAESFSSQKKSHAEFAEQFRKLYLNVCMFNSGAEIFEEATASQLRSYLLKSLGTDIAHLTLSYLSGTPNPTQMTPKICDQTIQSLESAEAKDAFKKLFASLASKEGLEDFYNALEEVGGPALCSLKLKPPDKKLRSDLLRLHREELKRQLESCVEPASGLLLALLFLVSEHFDSALHASGKFVPQISTLVQRKAEPEVQGLIAETQALVVKSMKKGASPQEGLKEEAEEKFAALKKSILK